MRRGAEVELRAQRRAGCVRRASAPRVIWTREGSRPRRSGKAQGPGVRGRISGRQAGVPFHRLVSLTMSRQLSDRGSGMGGRRRASHLQEADAVAKRRDVHLDDASATSFSAATSGICEAVPFHTLTDATSAPPRHVLRTRLDQDVCRSSHQSQCLDVTSISSPRALAEVTMSDQLYWRVRHRRPTLPLPIHDRI